jgi:hypothetical protein
LYPINSLLFYGAKQPIVIREALQPCVFSNGQNSVLIGMQNGLHAKVAVKQNILAGQRIIQAPEVLSRSYLVVRLGSGHNSRHGFIPPQASKWSTKQDSEDYW